LADTIYWINSGIDYSIRGAPLGGGGTVETLYDSGDGLDLPFGLAIEAAAGRIYWTNRGGNNGTIQRASLAAGGTVETLYDQTNEVNGPTGIAIHPAAGRIYWSNVGDNTIRRAPLTPHGTVETLYSGSMERVVGPTGVAVDPAAGRIYWANGAPDNRILSAQLAPHGNVTTLHGPQEVTGPWWVAIDRDGGRIYWTHWNWPGDGRIRSAPLAGGGSIDTLYDSTRGVSSAGGLAIDPNPAEPGPVRLEVARDTELATGGWLAGALDWVRDRFPRPTAPGLIYWGNGRTGGGGGLAPPPNPNANTIQRGALAPGGTFDSLYGSTPPTDDPVSGPAGLALLRAPLATGQPTVGWQFVLSQGPFLGPLFGPPAPDFDHLEQRLSCSPGIWAPDLLGSFLYRAPQTFAYQWRRDGTDLTGAPDPTKSHYAPTVAGSYSCRVTATNRAGSATQTSPAFTVTSGMLPSQ
jgi:DNA-binding beta-propeller fold protein YncE